MMILFWVHQVLATIILILLTVMLSFCVYDLIREFKDGWSK